jgi:signal transduction histidine kinase
VATNNGVGRIKYKNKVADISFYTVSDGLASNEINDIYVDENDIYIATTKGLSILKKDLKRVKPKPPIVHISRVNAKNQTLNINNKITLTHDNNQLFIRFVAITFQDSKNVIYQYRLKDDKLGWITTNNNFVDFSSVRPGKHVFEVRARKLNSDWSKIQELRFTIKPPFWQRWWFITLICALLIFIIVAIVRYLTVQQYQRQFRKIETDQRLQKERERIARDLHDNVGSQLAYIINSLDDTPAENEVLTSARTTHLRDFTKQTINQLRETIWAIRQENISIGELVTKIQKLIWQLTRYRTNFSHEIKVEGDQELKLTPLQALNLYRIVQEAINNIFNHSYATTLQITFNVNSQKSLDIIIADNGIGFDTSTKTHLESYGLQNMQERAKEIPAQFSIISAKGKGTRIKLKLNI